MLHSLRQAHLALLEWFVLGVLAPFALFPSAFRFTAFLVLPLMWLIVWRGRKQLLSPNPLHLPLLILSLMLLVSLYATYDLNISLGKVSGLLFGLALFLATARLSWQLGIAILLSSGTGLALLSLLSTQWTIKFSVFTPLLNALPPPLFKLPGATEGFQPNEVAGALVWVIFLFGASVLAFKDWKWRTLLLPPTAMVALVFALTQSRGGYFAFAVTLIFLFTLTLPLRWRLIAWGLLIGGAGVLGLLGLTATAPGGGNPVEMGELAFESRLEIWSRALYGIGDFPLTGMGLNTFRYLIHALYPLFFTPATFNLGHAHNEFLQVALDLGLPALVAFVALYLGTFWLGRETWLVSTWRERLLLLGLLGGVIAHAIFGLTDAIALGAKPSVLFWLLLGVIVAMHQQKTTKTQRIRNSLSN